MDWSSLLKSWFKFFPVCKGVRELLIIFIANFSKKRQTFYTFSLTPSEESWSVSTEEGDVREGIVSENEIFYPDWPQGTMICPINAIWRCPYHADFYVPQLKVDNNITTEKWLKSVFYKTWQLNLTCDLYVHASLPLTSSCIIIITLPKGLRLLLNLNINCFIKDEEMAPWIFLCEYIFLAQNKQDTKKLFYTPSIN